MPTTRSAAKAAKAAQAKANTTNKEGQDTQTSSYSSSSTSSSQSHSKSSPKWMLWAGVIAAVAFYSKMPPRVNLPPHMIGHPVVFDDELLSQTQRLDMVDLVKRLPFPAITADLNFYDVVHEHVGEARQAGPDGNCGHPLLMKLADNVTCALPGRVDIGRHFIQYGGVNNIKQSYDKMSLFAEEKFQTFAKKICPKNQQYLDPFQFNFIIQLPGQSVATHIDGVYFWGASRFQFPQWLLAAMKMSAMWENEFVHQVQVVAYVHGWDPADKDQSQGGAGAFSWWNANSNPPKTIPPRPGAGSAVDGTKTVHAAQIYGRKVSPPYIDKMKNNSMSYEGDDKWTLLSDGSPIRKYTTDDLRISVVYRSRCFSDKREADLYRQQGGVTTGGPKKMQLDDVLRRFAEDMTKRGVIKSAEAGMYMDRLQFAELILDTYVHYPIGEGMFPLNVCALDRLLPWTKPLLAPFC